MDSSAPIWLYEPAATLLLTFAFLLPAVLLPQSSERFFRRIENLFSRFAGQKLLAVFSVFFLVVLVRLALLGQLPVPYPGIHDEFSYLLMADTFAHGHLANPPHPLWRSFETFHVLFFPVYASKYPPAQGIVLALGQLLGHPWLGVLASAATMAAAFVWMLKAWMPARWAFLAGILAALKLCVACYWINSYWGGTVAAIGGAMVLGALGRLLKDHSSPALAVSLAVGFAILFNSRPYESVFFCIPIAVVLFFWLRRRSAREDHRRATLRQVVLPAAAILVATASSMAYYNWRLTGNPLDLPYAYATRSLHRGAMFLWQKPLPPGHYDNAQFDTFYNKFEIGNYNRTWTAFESVFRDKREHCLPTFFWPACWLLLPGALFVYRDTRLRLISLALLATVFGYCLVVWPGPHYLAPAAAAWFALLVESVRHLRTMHIRRRPIGAALSRAVFFALIFDVSQFVQQRIGDPLGWGSWGLGDRADLQYKLEATPGKHVVLVRYDESHSVHEEWVYNAADIDASKIIWARDLPGEANDQLLKYYPDRTIWLASPDTGEEPTIVRPPVSAPQNTAHPDGIKSPY
jgi:hypothetical protein